MSKQLDVVFVNADSSAAAYQELPDTYQGYGFLSYETSPMATNYVSAADVMKFRDNAWEKYHTGEPFLNLIESKYGVHARSGIEDLAKVKLKRRILGD